MYKRQAFFLLAERVSQAVKVVQSGQGADEVFGGYFWYPRMAADTGNDLERFRRHYFDRDHEEWLETVAPAYHGQMCIRDRFTTYWVGWPTV